MLQQQRELEQVREIMDDRQKRLERIELLNRQLGEDKEQLLDKLVQAQKETATLTVLRQENIRLAEESDRLRVENEQLRSSLAAGEELFRQRIEALEEESGQRTEALETEARRQLEALKAESRQQLETLREESSRRYEELERVSRERYAALELASRQQFEALEQESRQRIDSLEASDTRAREELGRARAQLDSLGILKSVERETVVTPAEIRMTVDSLEIYDRASEWRIQLGQIQRLNKALDAKVHHCEEEISQLSERLAEAGRKGEAEKAELLRRVRAYEDRNRDLQQQSASLEGLCSRLNQEKEALNEKLLWMQERWKAKLAGDESH